jgi:hypothetical protein
MSDSTEQFYHLRSFEDLLYDAVHLLYLAQDVDPETDPDGYEFTYTRSSILNSLLLLECAANCCIDASKLPGQFGEEIDKLPFMSKFEFFLGRINPTRAFNRGCREVQAVAELRKVRDSYVHPKVKKLPYCEATDLFGPDFGRTEHLRIPKDARRWHWNHAVLVLKSVNDFFNLFFLTWCNFDANTICGILLSSDPAEIPGSASIAIDGVEGLTRAVADFGIDFRFIGKRIHPDH